MSPNGQIGSVSRSLTRSRPSTIWAWWPRMAWPRYV